MRLMLSTPAVTVRCSLACPAELDPIVMMALGAGGAVDAVSVY
ncbi:hypothetical protein PJP10_29305 [Mycobacterium kansasii]